jgi:hypothetical protein
MGRHFPVMLAGNWIRRPLGAFFKHTGAFDKLLRTWHWHLLRSHLQNNIIVKVLSRTSEHGHLMHKDAFDLWWEWADKPVDNKPTIDAAVYDAVMALPPDEGRDRAKVNEAVRDGLKRRASKC